MKRRLQPRGTASIVLYETTEELKDFKTWHWNQVRDDLPLGSILGLGMCHKRSLEDKLRWKITSLLFSTVATGQKLKIWLQIGERTGDERWCASLMRQRSL